MELRTTTDSVQDRLLEVGVVVGGGAASVTRCVIHSLPCWYTLVAAEFRALCTTWASGSQLVEEEGERRRGHVMEAPQEGAREQESYLAHSGWLDTVSLIRLLVTLMM